MTVEALQQNGGMTEPERYLSYAEFAERVGVKRNTLNRYNLPDPDVFVGDIRGWRPETVDAWQAARPGRGRWRAARDTRPSEDEWLEAVLAVWERVAPGYVRKDVAPDVLELRGLYRDGASVEQFDEALVHAFGRREVAKRNALRYALGIVRNHLEGA